MTHPWSEAEGAKGCTSEARKPGRLLARARGGTPSGLVFLVRARQRTVFSGSCCGRNRPQRFSLACLGFSFLFRGVQRGCFSFQRERAKS